MPTIDAKRADLEKLAGRRLPDAELETALFLAKGELKGSDADVLRIELHDTNRPDTWTPEGIARAIRAARVGTGDDYPFFTDAPEAAGDHVIRAEAPMEGIRPCIGAFRARGPVLDEAGLESLIQNQEKLAENFGRKRAAVSVGLYRASGLRFPLRYHAVGRDAARFVPLGGEGEMTLAEILDRHPKGIAYAGLLAGHDTVPLFSDADGTVLSFPPVINSRAVGEVAPGDDDLLVEATGSDWIVCALVLNIFAADLADRGWSIDPVATEADYDTPWGARRVVHPRTFAALGRDRLDVPLSDFGRLLGVALDADAVVDALRRAGHPEVVADGDTVSVRFPATRLDALHPVDAVEDVMIVRGLDAFAPVMPSDFTVGRLDGAIEREDRIRERMIGLGFEETIGNILTDRGRLRTKPGIPDSEPLVEIANPMSETYAVLRDGLLPGLLAAEAASAGAAYPHRIFEAGEVAVADRPPPLSIVSTLRRVAALCAHPEATYTEVSSFLAALLSTFGLEGEIVPGDHPMFLDGRCAAVRIGGKGAGRIGEIHPAALERFGIHVPCAAFELDQTAFGG